MNITEYVKPKIYRITMKEKNQYISQYDDSIHTDYSRSANVKNTIEALKEEGADEVLIEVASGNFEDNDDHMKRANRIAKAAGYTYEYKEEEKHYRMDGIGKNWTERYFILRKMH